MKTFLKAALAGTASLFALATAASADEYDIPSGDLGAALSAYSQHTRVALIYLDDEVKGVHSRGAHGDLSASDALSRILAGTGFVVHRHSSGAIALVHEAHGAPAGQQAVQLAEAAPAHAASSVETIVVTSSKIKGDIQTVPIAITALSQEQLTARQIAGGPDLVKEVPNLTFSKTNFTGYNIQIRGIGTQAISVTTDPAVAVSFNDVPFIRNHFFEQEFFDVSQVEVLRGPQGTLYGRNATAGVVNVISAKPADQFEAMLSADWGNYKNRRYEGMINIPIVGDKLDFRAAGEWTKRDGYAFNEQTNQSTDGRDLWSSRVSLLARPANGLTVNMIWEHFQEGDDRLRSGKQLCKRDNGPSNVDGPAGPQPGNDARQIQYVYHWLQQGCLPVSLYSPQAYETPNGVAIPFIAALADETGYIPIGFDPYSSATQSSNLRVISTAIEPRYKAKNDTFEFNADYALTPGLTLTSQTAYNKDYLFSTEDYNRFDTQPGLFQDTGNSVFRPTLVGQDGLYCDPQLGCSSRFIAQDISEEHARQFYQELRLTSDYQGPFNFVAGANFMKYWTLEDYYVFSNASTLFSETWNQMFGGDKSSDAPHIPFDGDFANSCDPQPANTQDLVVSLLPGIACTYIDPNPLHQINGQGHNYFRSQNPYKFTSWAGFGEVYYRIEPDLKLTGGLRYTHDKKNFENYPSWTLLPGIGYPQEGVIDQKWSEWTGRFVATWTPKLDFTDQTMVYGSYAHGYKAGGANPPGVTAFTWFIYPVTSPSVETHPATFKPEFNNAFELGTKNTLFDGSMTLNASAFVYKYKGYQISQIVDRTAVNLNFDATVRGAELESTFEPVPGLRFNLSGGYENATIDDGQSAIDIMDRTAGNPNWMVVKPFYTETSNCIIPTYVANELILRRGLSVACLGSYNFHKDPVTNAVYTADPNQTKYPNYPGFDPLAGTADDPYTGQNTYDGVDYGAVPHGGAGFDKDISGNQLPNAPHFTLTFGAQYTMPLSENWAATLHGDFYWQSQSFARVFNDRPYDKIRGYSTTNLALILTSEDGWQVMGYIKNVFDKTAITGAFLNSDDSALTTNIFVTDPRLYGIRVTRTF